MTRDELTREMQRAIAFYCGGLSSMAAAEAALLAIESAGLRIVPAEAARTQAARDVLSERTRQIDAEGWSRAHDDAHSRGELALAAACYALSAVGVRGDDPASLRFWPFDDSWWRPGTPRRDLVKAAALILAEIERLDRAMVAASPIAAKEDSQ